MSPRLGTMTGTFNRPSRRDAMRQADNTNPVVIDCHDCMFRDTAACVDCVVTFLCREDRGAPVVVDLAEVRAMRLLDSAGLVPPLRHRSASGAI